MQPFPDISGRAWTAIAALLALVALMGAQAWWHQRRLDRVEAEARTRVATWHEQFADELGGGRREAWLAVAARQPDGLLRATSMEHAGR